MRTVASTIVIASCEPGSVTTAGYGLLDGQLLGIARLGAPIHVVVVPYGSRGAGDHPGNSSCDRCHDVATKLTLLPGVFLLQPEPLFLVEIGAPQVSDLLHNVEKDLLRTAGPFEGVLGFADVSSRDIGRTIGAEGYTVRHLFAPAFSVEPRVVPSLFACVDMDPSLLVLRVHLRPEVIFGAPDPAHTAADGATEHTEAIRPLAGSPSLRLQKLPDIAVPRESLIGLTPEIGTLIELDTQCTPRSLFRSALSDALGYSRRHADRTIGIVDPGKE